MASGMMVVIVAVVWLGKLADHHGIDIYIVLNLFLFFSIPRNESQLVITKCQIDGQTNGQTDG